MAYPIEDQLVEGSTNHTILWDTKVTGWVAGPIFRGTFSILWSCIVTILASIYTAIHMDIPAKHTPGWQRILEKIVWSMITLLCPEFMLKTAYRQYRKASTLTRELQAMEKQSPSTKDSNRVNSSKGNQNSLTTFFRCCLGRNDSAKDNSRAKSKFTMSYGYWATMGGFVINTAKLHDDHTRVTITPAGIKLLAKHGHFLHISKDQIADRSKASPFIKALVCIQIIWMLLQALDRVIAGYPLTLLEIHTAVHVLCALTIYIFWWTKPVDVEEALLIDPSGFEEIMAYIIMASIPMEVEALSFLVDQDPRWLLADMRAKLQPAELTCLTFKTEDVFSETAQSSQATTDLNLSQFTATSSALPDVITTPNGFTQSIPNATRHKEPTEITESSLTLIPSGRRHSSGFGLEKQQDHRIKLKARRRWHLCARALREIGVFDRLNMEGYTSGSTIVRQQHQRLAIYPYSFKNLVGVLDPEEVLNRDLVVTMFLVPIVYGGIHLTAWNLEFPTPTEALLWKISAIGIMTFGFTCLLTILVAICTAVIGSMLAAVLEGYFPGRSKHSQSSSRTHQKRSVSPLARAKEMMDAIRSYLSQINQPELVLVENGISNITNEDIASAPLVIVIILVFAPAIFFLNFSRFFLVVESFISLRKMPLGVFAVTPWVQNIPHI